MASVLYVFSLSLLTKKVKVAKATCLWPSYLAFSIEMSLCFLAYFKDFLKVLTPVLCVNWMVGLQPFR